MPEGCELAFALPITHKGPWRRHAAQEEGSETKEQLFLQTHSCNVLLSLWQDTSTKMSQHPTRMGNTGFTRDYKNALAYMTDNTAYVCSWATVPCQDWYKFIKTLRQPSYDSWWARAKLNTQCIIMWVLRAQIFVMVSKVRKATQAKNRMNDDFIVTHIWK